MAYRGKRRFKRTITRATEQAVLEDIRHGGLASVLALTEAIRVVYPELSTELLCNIVAAQSYERIERRQGYVPLNRADFYGCRSKVLSVYAEMRKGEVEYGFNRECDCSTDNGSV